MRSPSVSPPMCPRLFTPASGSQMRSRPMNASARTMLSSHSLSTFGGVGSSREMATRWLCNTCNSFPATEPRIFAMLSTERPPAPVYSPLNRRSAVPGWGVGGMGMCFPLSAASTAVWSMYSKPRSWGRRSTWRVFPFLDVFLILNESSAMAPATQPRQSSGVVAAAALASAAASAAAAAAASASSSSTSASGMPSPFFPASKNAPPPSTSQLGASPAPPAVTPGFATAPGTATCTRNSAELRSSFMVSMYRPLRYFTGKSSTSVSRIPAGSCSSSFARTSSAFIFSVSTISIISASLDAPRGNAMAVEMRGRELYGDRVMDTGSAARLAARSKRRSVSRCPMKLSLPSFVNRNRSRCVRRPSGV
mmetsp:Transcript_13186/g.55389  ORF Transcript_13186/g.55389 Transcript_13186/m.55389 type:complete len:365 (-) Transcript_13186:2306-3400(-)